MQRDKYLLNRPLNIFAKPYLELNLAAGVNINNGVATIIKFDTIVSMNTNYFSYNFATGIITVLIDGLYAVSCNTSWAFNTLGARLTNGVVNGGTRIYNGFGVPSVSGIYTMNFIHVFVAGDTLSHACYQTSGGVLALAINDTNQKIVRIADTQ